MYESERKWSLSHVRLFATPWTVACQSPPSVGFSRQEHWSWWPFASPRDLPNTETEPGFPVLQADSLPSEPPGNSINYKPIFIHKCVYMYTYMCVYIYSGGLVAKSFLTLCNPWTSNLPASSWMGFPIQEHWNGLPFPSPENLPDPGIPPGSPALQADPLLLRHQESPHDNKRAGHSAVVDSLQPYGL